tara:strand:+ start:498 stop:950 length:453 start_codon:yes stop_codon:yes gene_type:complete
MNIEKTKLDKDFHWYCKKTWKRSCINTLWCLLGCSIGDFGTIFFFQITNSNLPTLLIMILAIINGIITSIILETIVLLRTMKLKDSFYTALGMSLISMVSMEISMNLVDFIIVGKAALTFQVIPLMLLAGFLTPLPYNYWRLKKYNISCH